MSGIRFLWRHRKALDRHCAAEGYQPPIPSTGDDLVDSIISIAIGVVTLKEMAENGTVSVNGEVIGGGS
jgi:hypothetical protein